MPRLDGFEVCRRLKGSRPTCFLPVVLLTALSDVESKVRGFEAGADDFLNKPFHRVELLTRLRSLLRIRSLRDELDTTEAVLFSMVELLEGKDPRPATTRSASPRSRAGTGRAIGLDGHALSTTSRSAPLLHDIGKLGRPGVDPARSERRALRRGAAHLPPAHRARRAHSAPIESLAGALAVVRHHHERLDGSGYPEGLVG